jgi:hypothetical protein
VNVILPILHWHSTPRGVFTRSPQPWWLWLAASAWLSNQPTGPARAAGTRVVIDQIKDTDPEMAEKWRKTLPQEVPK